MLKVRGDKWKGFILKNKKTTKKSCFLIFTTRHFKTHIIYDKIAKTADNLYAKVFCWLIKPYCERCALMSVNFFYVVFWYETFQTQCAIFKSTEAWPQHKTSTWNKIKLIAKSIRVISNQVLWMGSSILIHPQTRAFTSTCKNKNRHTHSATLLKNCNNFTRKDGRIKWSLMSMNTGGLNMHSLVFFFFFF